MIVPMQKVSLITMNTEKKETLEQLRKLGILHLEIGDASTANLEKLIETYNYLERTMMLLPPEYADPNAEMLDQEDTVEFAEEVNRLYEEQRSLQDKKDKLKRETERLAGWGRFDPKEIRTLEKQGVFIRLYSIAPDTLQSLEEQGHVFIVARSKAAILAAAVFLNPENIIEENQFPIPEAGISELREEMDVIDEKLESITSRIRDIAHYRSSFEKNMDSVDLRIQFERAHANMQEDGELAFISGYSPQPKTDALKKEASKQGWALLFEEPSSEDPVPTLVENPKWIKIIQPVFDMLGTVPGYREYDISFFFLVFLSIFFAMIVGDAGYGFIFFGFTFAVLLKKLRKKENVGLGIPLLLVMSSCTIIWGAITGTWFGWKGAVSGNSFLSYLVIEPIATFNPRSSETVKHICFIIGTVQISIAHIWNFITEIKKKPRIRAFAQLGWFAIVIGLYYVVLNLVLSSAKYPVPQYALYLILGGLITVLLFGKQEGNFFKGVLRGIGGFLTLFLDGISALSDIISYIRLFAVGLATVEIARSFNEMAAGAGEGVIGIIGGVLILLLGHLLNIAMGALSVVVHGVRLNMLEFSGHLGMAWTGIPYKPFKNLESE